MGRMVQAVGKFVSTSLVFGGLAVLSTGGVRAEEVAAKASVTSATRSVADAEFSRFLEANKTPVAPVTAAKEPSAPASCEASTRSRQSLESLENMQQKFAAMRRQQLERMAEKGWSPKEAAAAGEPVVLNGTGYNLKGTASR